MSVSDQIKEVRWALKLMLDNTRPVDKLVSNPNFYVLKERLAELENQQRWSAAN